MGLKQSDLGKGTIDIGSPKNQVHCEHCSNANALSSIHVCICNVRRKVCRLRLRDRHANIDYLGLLTLLRRLLTLELISDSEAKKIAARLRVDMGADIAIFL